MRIKITEIEATSEDLRQSNSLAEGLSNILRRTFAGAYAYSEDTTNNDDEEDAEEE